MYYCLSMFKVKLEGVLNRSIFQFRLIHILTKKFLLNLFRLLDYVFCFKLQFQKKIMLLMYLNINDHVFNVMSHKKQWKIELKIKVIYIVKLKVSCSFKNYFLIKKENNNNISQIFSIVLLIADIFFLTYKF